MWAVKFTGTNDYVTDHISAAFDEGAKVFAGDTECALYCMELQDEGMECHIQEVEIIPTRELERLRAAEAWADAFIAMASPSNPTEQTFSHLYTEAQRALHAYRAIKEKETPDANT